MEQKIDEGLEVFKERNNWDRITKSLKQMPEEIAASNREDYLQFSDSTMEWLEDIGVHHGVFPPDKYVFQVRQSPCEEDRLILSNRDGSTAVVSATHQPWYSTVDQYLCYYFRLKKDQLQTGSKTILAKELPLWLEEKIEDWKGSGSKKKSLQVDLNYLLVQSEGKRLCYDEYALGNALMFQYLCRDFYFRSDSCNIQRSVQYGGGRCELGEDYQEKLPELKLEDYWLHEYYYGIGLSIEIAAVLLQIRKTFPQKNPWYDDLIKVALDLFCRRWLPTLVTSQDFFTRNAMARLIFLDVLENADDFPRGTEDSLSEEAIHMVDCCIWRGIRREVPLEFRYSEIDVPPESAPEALEHIEALLARVKEPVDILKYVKTPGHGLAMFCNPNHLYVSDYLSELSVNIQFKSGETLKPKRNKKARLFQDVRQYVMDAIRIVRLVEDKDLNNDHVCRVAMEEDFPENFEEHYNDLLKKGGGLILLERSRWKGWTASGAYNQKWTPWKVSLDDLKKEICQEKDAEVSIWEFYDMEYLAVTVPGQNSRIVLHPIDPNLL